MRNKIFKISCIITLITIGLVYSCKVEDPNTPPSVEDQEFSIDENMPTGSLVGTVVATDEDNDELTFEAVSGNEDNVFFLNPDNGEITVINSEFLDYEAHSNFSFLVKVYDGDELGDNSSIANITIFINDLRIPADGMIAYYPFNGSVNDESGFEKNGSLYGAVLTSDRFNQPNNAYSFDGLNDYINFNNALLPVDGSDFTLSFWVNSDNEDDEIQRVIFAQYQSDLVGRFHIFEHLGKIKIFSGEIDYPSSSNSVELNDITKNLWTNFIFINNGNQLYIYENGNLINRIGTSNISNVNSTTGWDRYGERYYKGEIDDIIIYDRILTEEEINILYKE